MLARRSTRLRDRCAGGSPTRDRRPWRPPKDDHGGRHQRRRYHVSASAPRKTPRLRSSGACSPVHGTNGWLRQIRHSTQRDQISARPRAGVCGRSKANDRQKSVPKWPMQIALHCRPAPRGARAVTTCAQSENVPRLHHGALSYGRCTLLRSPSECSRLQQDNACGKVWSKLLN